MTPVTLEIFIGHKASLHVLKVWVKLKKLGYVDSKRKFRPDFFGAINEFTPTGREFRITRTTISFIAELEKADLLRIRIEDGIEYYDSTLKSSAYANRSLNEIKSFVIEALKAVSEGAAKGATAAILEKVS